MPLTTFDRDYVMKSDTSHLLSLGLSAVTIKFEGTTPLLQHNSQLADPLNEYVREIKVITAKRKKTDADYKATRDLELRGGVYWSDEFGVYVPCEWIEGTILGAAKLSKLGTTVTRGTQVVESILPLDYAGKQRIKSLDDIASYPEFCFTKSVVISRKRVQRARPIFKNWSLEATIAFDPEVINRETLLEIVSVAGALIGIGDWRPKFGKFLLSAIDGQIITKRAA